jgi:hypothetical protein
MQLEKRRKRLKKQLPPPSQLLLMSTLSQVSSLLVALASTPLRLSHHPLLTQLLS